MLNNNTDQLLHLHGRLFCNLIRGKKQTPVSIENRFKWFCLLLARMGFIAPGQKGLARRIFDAVAPCMQYAVMQTIHTILYHVTARCLLSPGGGVAYTRTDA